MKTVGAFAAVMTLITGAALTGLGTSTSSATTVTATAEAPETQTYSADDQEIKAEVFPRGGYSATTEEEIEEYRASAITAAISSDASLSSVVELPTIDDVVLPVDSGSFQYTDGFGAARPGRSHLGQDFAASVGTPVYAAVSGCVSLSSESYAGYGVTIKLESRLDGDAVSTVYSHMVNGSRAVEVGECVTAGQYLGQVGSTGYVFGSCLHFEVHINGTPIEPRGWLNERLS